MFRRPVRVGTDKKVFSQTADKTKVVNLSPVNYRGGRRF